MKERKSLSLRFQPYVGSPLAEVADYLNSLDSKEMQRKIEELLVIGFLPYARKNDPDCSSERVRLSALECSDSLERYAAIMRLAHNIEQPQPSRSHRSRSSSRGIQSVPEIELADNSTEEQIEPDNNYMKSMKSLFGMGDDEN